jgi:hypothetical protein
LRWRFAIVLRQISAVCKAEATPSHGDPQDRRRQTVLRTAPRLRRASGVPNWRN